MQDQDHIVSPHRGQGTGTIACWRDDMVLILLQSVLSDLDGGILITLPSGRQASIGGSPVRADLTLATYGPVWKSIRRGTLGLADAYLDGSAETGDLRRLFEFFIDNRQKLERGSRGLMRGRRSDLSYHRSRPNTRHGSRRNIAQHYDLGNEFYGLWLDRSMMYSSGLYTSSAQSLEEAQETKIRAVLEALDIRPGARVLEIGCGWGAMAEAIAEAGGDVTAITISQEQLRYAQERLHAAGLGARARVRFEDYRDVQGVYDRIVSIEMVEAVGEDYWPIYFKCLKERLGQGGSAVLQAITIRESSFESYRARPDFIQRYIFPGGMLPTKSALTGQAARAGLACEPLIAFGDSYARTCAAWLQRFEAQWARIAELGFDDRFRRMWRYYLRYCEAGFARGVIDVGLYRFTHIG